MNEELHNLSNLDRVIHEPSRLLLVALLSPLESADFVFLLRESRLTRGNLTVHLSRLEEAGYIQSEKTIRGKMPHTDYRLTDQGRTAFETYRRNLGRIFTEEKA